MTDIRRRSREEILASLSSGSPNEIRDALIIACYWDKDWKWAFQQLRKFAEHGDELVLWAVATGVGFFAAFNGEIDEHEAQSILIGLKANANPAVAAAAEEAEADIEHFIGRRQRGEDVELVERLPEDWLLLPGGKFQSGLNIEHASITLDSGSFSIFKATCANANVPSLHPQ